MKNRSVHYFNDYLGRSLVEKNSYDFPGKKSLVEEKAHELIKILDDDPESSRGDNSTDFLQSLSAFGGRNELCSILDCEIVRKVFVKKTNHKDKAGNQYYSFNYDGREKYHRSYSLKESVYIRALRKIPLDEVLEFFEKVDPLYRKLYEISKELYAIASDERESKEKWTEFYSKYKSAKKEINNDGKFKDILKFRHTDCEETILIACVKKMPPIILIKKLLDDCKDAIMAPVPELDWIPLNYAIKYAASAEVVKELIPKLEKGSKEYDTEFDVLVKGDRIKSRNPLHHAIYYNRQKEIIKILFEAMPLEALFARDNCGHRPFETAIWWGRSAQTIKLLFKKEPEDFPKDKMIKEQSFDDVMIKLLRSATEHKDREKAEEVYHATPWESTYYTYKDFDIPSICVELSKSAKMREIVMHKSCDSFAFMLYFILAVRNLCVLLSYHVIVHYYLLNKDREFGGYVALMVLLLLGIILMTFTEVSEISAGLKYFTSLWNYFETFTIIMLLISWANIYMDRYNYVEEWNGTLMIITSSCLWLNTIFSLRSFSVPFATFVCGLFEIIEDLIPFLIISMLILLWFAFVLLGRRLRGGECEPFVTDYCTLPGAFVQMYSFFVGGLSMHGEIYDAQERETIPKDTTIDDFAKLTWESVIIFLFSLLVTILLLNVVIAIVNQSWEKVAKNGELTFWQYRLEFLLDAKRTQQTIFRSKTDKKDYKEDFHFMRSEVKNKRGEAIDKALHNFFIIFWPSDNYIGSFHSFFDRVLSSDEKIGSWSWQLDYERKMKRNIKFLRVTQAFCMLLVFSIVLLSTLLLGVMTFGLLLPPKVREFIMFGNMKKKIEQEKPVTDNDYTDNALLEYKGEMEKMHITHKEEMKRMQKDHMEEIAKLIKSLINSDDSSFGIMA